MEISYRFGFDAAHRFDAFPAGHAYSGVHGHSFQVEVALVGEPDAATGFIADLGEVERECRRVRDALDHRMLNDVEGLSGPAWKTFPCGYGIFYLPASPTLRE